MIMHKAEFKAKRNTYSYRQIIHARPDVVFPLLCPVREAEWLDGWDYKMIYSESGVVEEGAVFTTPHTGEPDTIWIVTRYDPDHHMVEFARFTPDSRTCTLKIAVKVLEGKKSQVDIDYTYTGITPAGNQFIDEFTGELFIAGVTFWENAMNHYLATGEKLTKLS